MKSPTKTTALRLSLLSIILRITVNSYADPARLRLPPLPPFLQRRAPASISAAQLSNYATLAAEAQNAYARGDTQSALGKLGALDALRRTLLAQSRTDAQNVRLRIAAACWQLSLPVCVVNSLEDSTSTEIQQTANDLRARLATFHYDKAVELLRRRRLDDAECHAATAAKFENTPRTEALWDQTRTRRDSVGQALFERRCASQIEEELPATTVVRRPYFELITEADRLSQDRNWRRSLAALLNARADIEILVAAFDADEKSQLIATGDAYTILNEHEKALERFETWVMKVAGRTGLTGPSIDNSRLVGEEAERVKASIATLQATIALAKFKSGVSELQAQHWQAAIDHFKSADRYLQLPENQIGIGAAHLKLDTGTEPFLPLAPTHLESAIAAYRDYLRRWPDAPNRRDVEEMLRTLDQELARRHDPNRIRTALGLAMASAVIRAVEDMQRRYHDYLNSQRPDLWPSSVRNYIEFGGTNPPTLVLQGQPVPLGNIGNRAPASFSSSSTIHVFAELAMNGTPPLPILPKYPDLETMVSFRGSGGEVTPESNSGQQEQSGPSRPRPEFELPALEELRSLRAGRSIDDAVLKEGDLIVTRANTIISTTIQIMGRSDVSHVMLYVGHGFIIEAVREGVQLHPLKEAVAENSYAMVMRNTRLTNPQPAIDYAFSKLGLRYDLWGVIAHPRFGQIQVGSGNREVTDRYFCSQLVGEAYDRSGAPLFISPANLLPGDLPSFGFLDAIKYVGHLKSERQPSFIPVIERGFDFLRLPAPNQPTPNR